MSRPESGACLYTEEKDGIIRNTGVKGKRRIFNHGLAGKTLERYTIEDTYNNYMEENDAWDEYWGSETLPVEDSQG